MEIVRHHWSPCKIFVVYYINTMSRILVDTQIQASSTFDEYQQVLKPIILTKK